MIILSQLWNKLCRLSNLNRLRANRRAESAGNGVLSSGEKNFSVHRTYMNFLRPRKRATEAALYALRGSLLPENGADATPFSSDVYNNSTRTRKRLAGVSLYGRSMVEMLGVLAIIGVLSVGAIAGYQKAMTKYRLNKMTEQYNTIINYVSSTKAQWLHKEMGDTYVELFPIFKKMNVIPNEMDKDQSTFLYDILGNPSYLRQRTDYLEFAVYLNAQNGEKFYSSLTQLETCRTLFQYVLIPNHAEVDRIALYVGSGDTSHAALEFYGDSRDCEKSKSCLRSMTLSDIENACHVCDEENLCRILAIWR